MLTVKQVKNNISNYKIENGIVFDKSTNRAIQDEEKILEIKSSVMIYREAKQLFDSRLRGAPNEQDYYIGKSIMIYGLNGEINDYPQNKIIRNIIENNGNISVDYGGNDLLESEKFSFLCEPKKEYGIAIINYKAHQKGLDISNLDVSIDLSDFKKTGVSVVNIKYDKNQYVKMKQESNKIEVNKEQNIISIPLYQHPKANELNELEEQKQIAKQNNDEVAYNYAKSNIERIIRETPVLVSSEQWDSMSIDEQIAFAKVKINESKILHDEDDFKYWNSNLQSLQNKRASESQVTEQHSISYNNAPNSSEVYKDNLYQEMITELEQKKDYKYYYQEMMKAVEKRTNLVNSTDEEKKQIVGEIFYNQGFLVESLNTQQEFNDVMNLLVNNLNDNQLQKIVLTDMQERYNKLFKKQDNNLDNQQQVEISTQEHTELTNFINQLRERMNKISAEYKSMLLDGFIDDEELAVLISRTNELISNTDSLKPLANNPKELMLLNSITEMLHNEQNKMIIMQNGIKNIEETRRTL